MSNVVLTEVGCARNERDKCYTRGTEVKCICPLNLWLISHLKFPKSLPFGYTHKSQVTSDHRRIKTLVAQDLRK